MSQWMRRCALGVLLGMTFAAASCGDDVETVTAAKCLTVCESLKESGCPQTTEDECTKACDDAAAVNTPAGCTSEYGSYLECADGKGCDWATGCQNEGSSREYGQTSHTRA